MLFFTLAKGEGIAFECLFVCVHRTFVFFPRKRLSDCDEIYTIGATSREDCYNDNYDIIGHVVWQGPYIA